MPQYVAPFALSSEQPPSVAVPTSGIFTVPVCTTPERFKRIMDALWREHIYNAETTDLDHIIDWLEACTHIIPGCVPQTAICRTIALTDSRVQWYPESPFTPGENLPAGYLFHPFTVVDNSMISTLISQWGLGYKIGDVYTDIFHFPLNFFVYSALITDYGNLPRFRLTLTGKGTVKLHLLNIPQGGRILTFVDGYVNLLQLKGIELDKDLTSYPAETQVEIIIPIEMEQDGEHTLDVVFAPIVDNTIGFPIFYGGGIREIELCGFGVSMLNDPCCPEDSEINYQIYYHQQFLYQQYLAQIDDGDTAASFDAPANFDSDPADSGGEIAARTYALCRLVKQYVATAIYNQALAIGAGAAVLAALTRFMPFPAPVQGVISDAIANITATTLGGLLNDCQAVIDVACCMIGALQGVVTTKQAIASSLDGCGFTFGSNAAQLAGMVDKVNKNPDNARALIAAMNITMRLAVAGSGATEADCDCTCCADDVVLIDPNGHGTQFTYMGNCLWRFDQPNPTVIGNATVYYFAFRTLLNECILVENSPDPAHPTQGVGLDTSTIDCDDVHHDNFVGGFSGSDSALKLANWSQADTFNYFKITLIP